MTSPRAYPQLDRAVGSGGPDSRLQARDVTLRYQARVVSTDLTVTVPDGELTVVIGPNACGKSTLLRALARLIEPTHGQVLLDGQQISTLPSKEVARRLGLLPQSSIAPDGITVRDLVARGRYPHMTLFRQLTPRDHAAIHEAMERTGTLGYADRVVDELSGGQRQRVWIAMVLAQDTLLLLLDEPTTYLDITHQVEVLDLCARLHADGRTLVAVLHDLNQAARYATHLIAMKDGAVVAQGPPAEVITEDIVAAVYGLQCRVVPDPETGTPLVIVRAHQPPKDRP